MSDSKALARYLANEVRRQTRNSCGNTFGTVEAVTAEGRLQVRYRGGLVEVPPSGVVEPGESINLNRARGLLAFDGDAMYAL